jgi:hypothetical protein
MVKAKDMEISELGQENGKLFAMVEMKNQEMKMLQEQMRTLQIKAKDKEMEATVRGKDEDSV